MKCPAGCSKLPQLLPMGGMYWCSECECHWREDELIHDNSKRFTAVKFARQYPQHDVAEHHLLMAFTHDEDAELFREWWIDVGSAAFAAWLGDQEEDEQ